MLVWIPFAVVAVLLVVGVIALAVTNQRVKQAHRELSEQRAEIKAQREAQLREIETTRKAAEVEAKELAYTYRREIDAELKETRAELTRTERRLAQREETLDRRQQNLEKTESEINARAKDITEAHREAQEALDKQKTELERISGLSAQEATQALLRAIESDIRHEAAKMIREIEEEAKAEANKKARKIITLAIQRCAVDQVAESTVSVVPIPSDDMKGRIIGREGRNIRAFEALTGVDLIIDDTPEAVVVSAFDPVRREVARTALTALITDGRIHPARIEELVEKARKEVDERMREAADEAILKTGVTGLHPELVKLLGKLKFRTSYGQNILDHSVECAHLAGAMAAELDLNVDLAIRGALLHDLGKALDFEQEGPHSLIGVDIARHYGEREEVVNAIGAHHGDVEFNCLESVIVQVADAISASRPGARRESLEAYIKRLEKLEKIAGTYDGVEKAYAIQAGRELRIMVVPDRYDDMMTSKLARDVAKRIEDELEYPGQIRVTVIREMRAVEYAK